MADPASWIAPAAFLQGQTIVSADDEPLICVDVEDILREAGAEVITTHDIDHASRALHTKPLSAAVLDIHLGPHPIDLLCDDLKIRGIPFVFSTGDPEAVSRRWGRVPVLTKPFGPSDLIGALISALVGTSTSQQPFESLARIHEQLFQAESRVIRQRLVCAATEDKRSGYSGCGGVFAAYGRCSGTLPRECQDILGHLDAKPENAFFGSQVVGGTISSREASIQRATVAPSDG